MKGETEFVQDLGQKAGAQTAVVIGACSPHDTQSDVMGRVPCRLTDVEH
jgi:hypothetical protein